MDRPKLSIAIRSCHCVHNSVAFQCQVSYSLDHEIMSLLASEECFEVIKRHTVTGWPSRCLSCNQKVLVRLHVSRMEFVPPPDGRIYSGPTR
jgi:hypothetical protein